MGIIAEDCIAKNQTSSQWFPRTIYCLRLKKKEALRALEPSGSYLFSHFLKMKSETVPAKNWSGEKPLKKDHMTYIIATNFAREKLTKIFS